MTKPQRIHIFGASGSGTTTLGVALSDHLGIPHFDTDDYFWFETDPPYSKKVDPKDRVRNIRNHTNGLESWILSGSLCGWGDPLMKEFTLAVFLRLNHGTRMQRLVMREKDRYGARIEPEGDLYLKHREFIEWAGSYDTAKDPTRSLDQHEKWIPTLQCPCIIADSARSIDQLVGTVSEYVLSGFSS